LNQFSKRWALALLLGVVALNAAAESAERNRVALNHNPAFAVSLHTGASVRDGDTAGALWQLELNPVLMAELTFLSLFSAGVTLPFRVDVGHFRGRAPSFATGAGGVKLELGIAGGRGALYYHTSIYWIPGAGGENGAGAAAAVACIRDPAALKAGVKIRFEPDTFTRRWRLSVYGCTLAALIVINEYISIENSVEVAFNAIKADTNTPPSLVGGAGLYFRKNGFTASFLVMRNFWNLLESATAIAGIAYSWSAR